MVGSDLFRHPVPIAGWAFIYRLFPSEQSTHPLQVNMGDCHGRCQYPTFHPSLQGV